MIYICARASEKYSSLAQLIEHQLLIRGSWFEPRGGAKALEM